MACFSRAHSLSTDPTTNVFVNREVIVVLYRKRTRRRWCKLKNSQKKKIGVRFETPPRKPWFCVHSKQECLLSSTRIKINVRQKFSQKAALVLEPYDKDSGKRNNFAKCLAFLRKIKHSFSVYC